MRVSALCLLISATFTRLFNAFQFNRSSWAVPELYELIQGVPLSERGWKNSPVPTAGTNPSARPPHQSKVFLSSTLSPSPSPPPKQNPLGHCCLWGLRRRTGAPPAHRYILHLKTEIPF